MGDLGKQGKKTVVIADNQFLILEALYKILPDAEDLMIVSSVETAADLEKFFKSNTCELLMIDVSILEPDEMHLLETLQAEHPGMAILVLSNPLNRITLGILNQMGVRTILFKNAGRKELFEAIHASLEGRKYYSPEIVDMLLDTREKYISAHHLTGSEKEIVRLIAEGLTTKEIAKRKSISFHTVMTHRRNIFKKTGIKNVSELMMYAIKNGLIDNIEYYI
jgi:DNA-binding NarL/FixJ family response regulator